MVTASEVLTFTAIFKNYKHNVIISTISKIDILTVIIN